MQDTPIHGRIEETRRADALKVRQDYDRVLYELHYIYEIYAQAEAIVYLVAKAFRMHISALAQLEIRHAALHRIALI